jgi:hypothetical protein
VFLGGAGFLGTVISALYLYPPLEHKSIVSLLVLLFGVLTIVNLALDGQSARLVRPMYLAGTAFFMLSAAVFFLNGALDKREPAEVQATVVRKVASRGQGGTEALAVTVMWNEKQNQMVENLTVSSQTFSAIKPGDSFRVAIHPGAFSMPWYGGYGH